MKKKLLGYAMGASTAITLAAGSLFAQAKTALTGEDLFGGTDSKQFAANAGLASGSLTDTIASLIRTVLGFLGIVAVLIILMGGFKWMTAGGSETKVKEAKTFIIQGIIGLVIVIAAFAIAQFVITQVTGAVSNAG